MDLNLLHLIFSLTLDGSVEDRYQFFEIRRLLPDALKRRACGRLVACRECRDAPLCEWAPLLGQPLSTDPEALRRHQKPPLPLVLDLPLPAVGTHHAAPAEMGLTLVGTAVTHAGLYLAAVKDLLTAGFEDRRLSVVCDAVYSQGVFGERSPVEPERTGVSPVNLQIISASDLADKEIAVTDTVALRLHSPLRLLHDGRLSHRLDVSLFLRGLVRRISSLVSAYGAAEVADDFSWLSLQSHNILLEDSCFRFVSSGRASIAGIMGEGVLSGNLVPFLPYLYLGELLHAGKGASWGFGRYEVLRG